MPTEEKSVADAAEKKEPEGESQDAAASERAALESSARAKGWRPKGEWTGDPAEFVDAKEFIQREPLFAALKEARREVKETKRTVDAMAAHFKKTLDTTVAARVAELQAAKKEAIKEGDVEKVEGIDKQIEQTKATKADLPTKAEVAPEVEAWVKDNKWFIDDAEMHDFALAYNDTYLKRNPGDTKGCLLAVTKAARKAYPEKFAKPADDGGNGKDDGDRKRTPAGSVEGGTAPATPKAKGYDMRRLSADQKRVYDQLVKPRTGSPVLSHDEYFSGLEKIGELQ